MGDRCPLCGHITTKRFNIVKHGEKEWKSRSQKFKDVLNKIRKDIYIPTDKSQEALSQFLLKIKEVDEEKCLKMMYEFYESKLARKGLGFAYLAKMINNFNENYNNIMSTEKKIYGSVKPARRIE